MKDAYPELEVQRDFINKMVRLEEERFGATMTVGLKKWMNFYRKTPTLISGICATLRHLRTPIDLIFVVLNTTFPKVKKNTGLL
jgi:hypothetical protein